MAMTTTTHLICDSEYCDTADRFSQIIQGAFVEPLNVEHIVFLTAILSGEIVGSNMLRFLKRNVALRQNFIR
jgi:hypothetical protein